MGFACMTHVIELAKVANYRVWADAPLASLRQLPDVSKGCVNQLAGAGVVSLKDIERLGPRTLERVCAYMLLILCTPLSMKGFIF